MLSSRENAIIIKKAFVTSVSNYSYLSIITDIYQMNIHLTISNITIYM